MDPDELLRTYGIAPEKMDPQSGPVRSRLTAGNIFGQWIAFAMFGIGPLLLGLFLLIVVPVLEIRLGLAAFFGILGVVLGGMIAWDVNEWVELDGSTLRWKHLFTRRLDERVVSDIESIETLTLAFRTVAVQIVEKMYGRIKGFEIRFLDTKQGVRIFRTDPTMTNVREILQAIIARMSQYGEVIPEIVEKDGIPMIRRLTLRRH